MGMYESGLWLHLPWSLVVNSGKCNIKNKGARFSGLLGFELDRMESRKNSGVPHPLMPAWRPPYKRAVIMNRGLTRPPAKIIPPGGVGGKEK